mgnify:CR=1 FL=1|jgi:hypothetical protein|tara:strand:- start:96 stop:299 length:204 start_codon:yes stop_codon:yes gene_type:complete
MKWEVFETRTVGWSFSDVVDFLMEGNKWCDDIMGFIKQHWKDENIDFDLEDIDVYELLNMKIVEMIE